MNIQIILAHYSTYFCLWFFSVPEDILPVIKYVKFALDNTINERLLLFLTDVHSNLYNWIKICYYEQNLSEMHQNFCYLFYFPHTWTTEKHCLPCLEHLIRIYSTVRRKDTSKENASTLASLYISSLIDKMYSIIRIHGKKCPKTYKTFSEFPEYPMAKGLICPILTGAWI